MCRFSESASSQTLSLSKRVQQTCQLADMPTKALCDLEYITMGTGRSNTHIKTLYFCNSLKTLRQAHFTYFMVLSSKKQVAAMILAVILSALAVVAKA